MTDKERKIHKPSPDTTTWSRELAGVNYVMEPDD